MLHIRPCMAGSPLTAHVLQLARHAAAVTFYCPGSVRLRTHTAVVNCHLFCSLLRFCGLRYLMRPMPNTESSVSSMTCTMSVPSWRLGESLCGGGYGEQGLGSDLRCEDYACCGCSAVLLPVPLASSLLGARVSLAHLRMTCDLNPPVHTRCML